jgi:hypothetical protein
LIKIKQARPHRLDFTACRHRSFIKNGSCRLTFDGQEWFLTAEEPDFFKKRHREELDVFSVN